MLLSPVHTSLPNSIFLSSYLLNSFIYVSNRHLKFKSQTKLLTSIPFLFVSVFPFSPKQLLSFICLRKKEMESPLIFLSHNLKCISSLVFKIFLDSNHFSPFSQLASWYKPLPLDYCNSFLIELPAPFYSPQSQVLTQHPK